MERHPDEMSSSRTLDFEGGRIHYHDLGHGEPLLLLPAYGPLPGTTAWLTFQGIIKDLSARFRCILLDYPNFGRSSPIVFNEPVHDLYVRQAIAVLDHLGVQEARVLGASTGGTVAIDLVLTAPERVTKLVVGGCEASTGGDPYLLSPWPSEVARLSYDCQFNPPDRDRIRRLLTALVHDAGLISDALVNSMYEWRVAEPEHADSWSRSKSVPKSQLDKLAGIQTPVLIIHGRFDRMVPLEGAIRLLNYLPTADLVVLNRCGHWPTVERPADYTRCALQFL
jgi:pimeloyl-ACP methyl ester carboxylesterase